MSAEMAIETNINEIIEDGLEDKIDSSSKKKRFFLLKVIKLTGGKKPIMVSARAEDEEDARRQFELMRPHAPILQKNKYQVLRVFDMGNPSDLILLENHPDLNIALHLRKTSIGTCIPMDINHPLCTVTLREKLTEFVHVTRNKKDYVDKIEEVSNRIGIHLFYDGENTLFSESQCLEQVESIIQNDKNIVFILYEETIGETIKFAEAAYDMVKGKNLFVNFFYVYEDQIYEIMYDNMMRVKKIYA